MPDAATIRRAFVIVSLLLVAGAVMARASEWYQVTDFFCLYQGPRALALRQDPYDVSWLQSATSGTYPVPLFAGGGSAPSNCRYGYPLWTAAVMLPLGVLPLEVAATLWAALAIGCVVFGMAAAWRAVRAPRGLAPIYAIVVVVSQPFWLLLMTGQISGVDLGVASALALAMTSSRMTSSGIALAALALKPQVVTATIPAVFIRSLVVRERRLAAVFLATLLAMAAVPMILVPSWPIEWVNELISRRLRITALLPTAWGFAGDVFGNVVLGAALGAALLLTVWAIVRGRQLTGLDVLALSLPVSLFIAPYAWSYDHLVLAVPWAYLFARLPADPGRWLAGSLGIVVLATMLPWLLYLLSFGRGLETLSAAVPAVTAVAVAFAVRAGPPA